MRVLEHKRRRANAVKGSSVPQQTMYLGGYQLAYYEGREQPYSIWTMGSQQRVVRFAASKQEAEQWVAQHPRAVA